MNWRESAACRVLTLRESTRLFFGGAPADVAEAQQVCAKCPVRAECLAEADRNERGRFGDKAFAAGIYGGLTPAQRRVRRDASRGAGPR